MEAWELAGIVVGLLVGGATLLGFVSGVIWWMSALFHEVKGIRRDLREHIAAVWPKVDAHSETLQKHGTRISILEEWRDSREHESHG